ncbi:bifunctional phosphoribosyl-AMP cyclohydrolase/phosphoribosyl-ATP diphosphatase HisIE [Roseivirga misakiensis]|uniref:Histidine biosynthesis bifunctional protein HisIE n=1 Tax=Roseivirga misakiensis TaxID=1563681 RepID=A0A1E5T167_9BACT|nr:bifunctional phosphoribosyl-AMP cyclohydrolase/phosphoribosyl-ATP diphosphatase HisIE [Roseivirga misakiensis]OEK05109.1 bifunctional phosphoribosyl-AMP cyclohydrolase/phosphoribosyl-ATP diphosphatase [Roseivirga misakiensis]
MRIFESIDQVNFEKNDGLIPAVIQDAQTRNVLMLGYMDKAALAQTLETKRVTFFSRSKQRLWVKGETSKNYLNLVSLHLDCDDDSLLVKVNPEGPTCHKGDDTCWAEVNENPSAFLDYLGEVIKRRKSDSPEESYTASLFAKGINKVAQKVGEEAVELVIEAKDNDADLFKNEAADLLFHYLMLLEIKDFSLNDIIQVLKERHK